MDREFSPAQIATAITSREHLIRFLQQSGREFLVLRADDLVRSLPEPWAANVELVQQVVSSYRDHRRVMPSGLVEDLDMPDPLKPGGRVTAVGVPIMKDDTLTFEELENLVGWAHRQMEKIRDRNASRKNLRRG